MNVLVVVEDDPDMRLLVRMTLTQDPRLEVQGEAATAEEAVRAARELDPDLIILDHFILGDVMGLQAAPLLKQAAPRAKVLLFTSHDLLVESRREVAVDEYLRKDHLDRLLPTSQRLLGLEPTAA